MSILRRPLSGHSEAKGRNGYFHAVALEANLQGNPAKLRLEVFSKTRSDTAPLVLELDPHDAAVIEAILRDFIAGSTW